MPLKNKKLNKEVYTTIEIDDKFAPVEVIDNLTSTETDKALSANQGRVLNEKTVTGGRNTFIAATEPSAAVEGDFWFAIT